MSDKEVLFINIKDYLDRYDLSKFTQYVGGTNLTINSYFLYKLKQLNTTGYFRVRQERHRADTISYIIYNGIESLWWLILYYNDISDWRLCTSGTTLKLFSLSDLESLILNLIQKQLIKNQEDTLLGSF